MDMIGRKHQSCTQFHVLVKTYSVPPLKKDKEKTLEVRVVDRTQHVFFPSIGDEDSLQGYITRSGQPAKIPHPRIKKNFIIINITLFNMSSKEI